MNQSQLIDIIGNRDVVTIIQDYMCGTPIQRNVVVYDSESDEDSNEEDSNEEDSNEEDKEFWRTFESTFPNESYQTFNEEVNKVWYSRDKKIERVISMKLRALKKNHNIWNHKRIILGIPNVPLRPVYAVGFKYGDRFDEITDKLYNIGWTYKATWQMAKNRKKGMIVLAIPYPIEERVEELAEIVGIYEFTKKDISREYYYQEEFD